MSRVNIIMAAYQGEKYISEQIESILKSTYSEFVLTIYDDGSQDQTAQIVKEYEEKYPEKIEYVRNSSNMGHFNNFMQGVVDNPYDYVMFCDQDDVWKNDKIESTLRYMKKIEKHRGEQTPIVVFTDAQVVDENLEIMQQSFHESSGLDTSKLDFAHMLMENKMMGCTMMLNHAVIEKVKKLPSHARYHDWWIGLIASSFGEIHYLKKATLLYRQHGNNVVGNITFSSYIKNRVKNLKEQKKAIEKNIAQAKELYEMYGQSLPADAKKQLEAFLSIPNAGFFQKRKLVLSYRFLKSGILRNLGLLLLI